MSENRGDDTFLCWKWNTERTTVSMIRAVHLYNKNKSILWADESNLAHQTESQGIVERSFTLSSHYFPIPLISFRNTTYDHTTSKYNMTIVLLSVLEMRNIKSWITHIQHNHCTMTQQKSPLALKCITSQLTLITI